MSVRFGKKRCRNCPETPEGLPAQLPSPLATYTGEGDGLWKAASVACGTVLELLFRYVTLSVPGEPLPQLERLYARLGEIINIRKRQEKEYKNDTTSKNDGSSSAD